MKDLIQQLKEAPYIAFDFGLGKLPYGPVAFGNGFMLGLAEAFDLSLETLTVVGGFSAPSIIAACRAGIGTTRRNTLATIINYADERQKIPQTEEEWKEYHSLRNIGRRCTAVGLRYQIETIIGFGVGYVYGKMNQ